MHAVLTRLGTQGYSRVLVVLRSVCVWHDGSACALRPLQEDARKREELLPQYHFQYVKVRRMCAVPAQMWPG